jgi:predicted RecB family nuclease
MFVLTSLVTPTNVLWINKFLKWPKEGLGALLIRSLALQGQKCLSVNVECQNCKTCIKKCE